MAARKLGTRLEESVRREMTHRASRGMGSSANERKATPGTPPVVRARRCDYQVPPYAARDKLQVPVRHPRDSHRRQHGYEAALLEREDQRYPAAWSWNSSA